ncbi:hypothetical protein D3C76_486220 [compost metagenome]|jgi:hypothetical protein
MRRLLAKPATSTQTQKVDWGVAAAIATASCIKNGSPRPPPPTIKGRKKTSAIR